MAEYPGRIRKLFTNDTVDEDGIYGIKLTKNGVKKTVYVDDYLPVLQERLVFASSKGPELWVPLIEKAFAKVHGSYGRIVAGNAAEALRDLTGAPSWTHDLKKYDGDLFGLLEEADGKKHIVCAGCDSAAYGL